MVTKFKCDGGNEGLSFIEIRRYFTIMGFRNLRKDRENSGNFILSDILPIIKYDELIQTLTQDQKDNLKTHIVELCYILLLFSKLLTDPENNIDYRIEDSKTDPNEYLKILKHGYYATIGFEFGVQNHLMTITGYTENSDETINLIVKNSWGPARRAFGGTNEVVNSSGIIENFNILNYDCLITFMKPILPLPTNLHVADEFEKLKDIPIEFPEESLPEQYGKGKSRKRRRKNRKSRKRKSKVLF